MIDGLCDDVWRQNFLPEPAQIFYLFNRGNIISINSTNDLVRLRENVKIP
jgi:hypothetical protein